jgi:hypothetical protein
LEIVNIERTGCNWLRRNHYRTLRKGAIAKSGSDEANGCFGADRCSKAGLVEFGHRF